MSDLTCDYHPQREAIDKCYNCNRLICLDDKQVLNQNRSSFFKHSGSGIYCSKCYYDKIKSLNNPFSAQLAGAISFVIMIFFGGFILLFNVILGGSSSFLTYFFFGFIVLSVSIIWLVYFIIKHLSGSKYNLDYARQASERLVMTQISQPRTPRGKDSVRLFKEDYIFCMNCGTETKSSKTFCPQCGQELHPAK